jgi:hypothetical protein
MYGRKKDFSGITKISKLSKGDEFCINILAYYVTIINT